MMPRRPTGQVIVDERRRSPVYAIRFNAGGRRQYVTLGSARDGWTQAKAQDELERALAAVRLGTWTPPEPESAPETKQDPTFHEFSSDWFEASKGEWRESTRLDYEWQLSHHLLKFFCHHRLSQITIAEVDRYRAAKLAQVKKVERVTVVDGKRVKVVEQVKLSAASINKTITRLAQILEVAVEYGLIDRNPAKGKRRRLKASKPASVWLDSAEQITALLDAAAELDKEVHTNGQHVRRRAILATLTLAGLRIGELIELRWRDVNLADGWITVGASKTDAGVRRIDLLPALRDELSDLKARTRAEGGERVFPTPSGGPMSPSNVRNRTLAKAVERANERLAKAEATPLPENLTPHKLRHTFASLLVALGTDPGAVMDQLGHTDPTFTLRVYRHGMRRDEKSKAALRELVGVEVTKRQRKGSRRVEQVAQ
jgi:integrase